MAYTMTDSSLLLLRRESLDAGESFLMEKLLALFNLSAFLLSIVITHTSLRSIIIKMITVFLFATMGISCLCMHLWCPEVQVFGGERRRIRDASGNVPAAEAAAETVDNDGYFRTPFVPFLPCFGIFFNWYLIAQLEMLSIMLLLGFLALCTIFYYVYSIRHSVLGKSTNIGVNNYKAVTSKLGMELRDVPQSKGDERFASNALAGSDEEAYDDGVYDVTSERHQLLLVRHNSLPVGSK